MPDYTYSATSRARETAKCTLPTRTILAPATAPNDPSTVSETTPQMHAFGRYAFPKAVYTGSIVSKPTVSLCGLCFVLAAVAFLYIVGQRMVLFHPKLHFLLVFQLDLLGIHEKQRLPRRARIDVVGAKTTPQRLIQDPKHLVTY